MNNYLILNNCSKVDIMPKKGHSQKTINKILKILENVGNQGIWIRELSRQSKVPVSTVHYYLTNVINEHIVIENMAFGNIETSHYKIVRLKNI